MKTDEQIAAFEAKRAAHVAAMEKLMSDAGEAGSTLTAEQSEEYDTLQGEVKSMDVHLARLRTHQAIQNAKATPITPEAGASAERAAAVRSGEPVKVAPTLPKGWAFARYVGAIAHCKGNIMQAAEFAKARWHDSSPQVELALKAAVLAGTTTHSTWAGPLVEYETMASEFIDLLRPTTIIGRIQNPGLRRVPFNIRIASTTTGSSVNWVGEGAAKPVSAMAFGETTLGFYKAAGIVVITEELARFSRPGAEDTITEDLRRAMQQFLDTQFVLPSVAAVAGTNPASITNGVTQIGLDAAVSVDSVQAAMTEAFNAMVAVGLTPTHWITTPAVAVQISGLRTTQSVQGFPGFNQPGDPLQGLPVIASAAAPANLLILISAPEIYLADDGGVDIDVSREASVMMDSAPVAGTTAYTSLWQHNLVGIRAERFINWGKRNAQAVQVINMADVTP
jgi:HK97 family phage major capsid protein